MRRREFITLLGGAAAAWPLSAHAQQSNRMRRLGYLSAFPENDPDTRPRISALVSRLKELGWSEGSNLEIVYRYAGGDATKIKLYAEELVLLQPDVILANTTPAAMALHNATQIIPIVFNAVSDPIGSGIAKSMARPGGNATGFTNFELTIGEKLLGILKEIAPNITRVAVLFDPKVGPHNELCVPSIITTAKSLAIEIVFLRICGIEEVIQAVADFAREQNGGLLVLPDTTTAVHRETLIALASRHRLPAVYPLPIYGKSGGLISYGFDSVEAFLGSAVYIDHILKGARPEDLPLQAPTKYQMLINLKTAKTLGLAVPPMLLARADEVIE